MPGFERWLETPAGRVAVISTRYSFGDRLGSWKARWGIGRMSYLVPPGLYAIGVPTADDPVLVTANYKMSFDMVRRVLGGRNVWLLVLEAYGINVWCAAGKGTFGTGELVRRVRAVRLAEVVNHRRLVVPLLGAAGICAQEVQRRTQFKVRYATIRASDLPAYLDNGMSATEEMRELTFTAAERLTLVPIEMISAFKSSLPVIVILFIAGAVSGEAFSPTAALMAVLCWIGAVLAGTLFTPMLLPVLPTRSFAIKGAFAGLVWALLVYGIYGKSWNQAVAAATFIILPAVAAFFALNFTGSTPFTSPSGVKKEMRLSLPVIAGAVLTGAVLSVFGTFLIP